MNTNKKFLIGIVALMSFLSFAPLAFALKMLTPEQRLEQFKTELKLSSEQIPKVKAVLEETAKKFKELPSAASQTPEQRKDRGRKISDILAGERTSLTGILDSAQLAKYGKLPMTEQPSKQK